MTAAFRLEALAPHHDRKGFSCGVEALDQYFTERVTQDMRRRLTACYVAIEAASSRIAGYCTLAAAGIPLDQLPASTVKRLPRYPSVPVARLGRLAVAAGFQGQRLGSALLWDALTRAARSEVAVVALVVDARNEQAEAFYRHQGFAPLGLPPRQLFLPLKQDASGR